MKYIITALLLVLSAYGQENESIPHPARKFAGAMQIDPSVIKLAPAERRLSKALICKFIKAKQIDLSRNEGGAAEDFWICFESVISCLQVKDAYQVIKYLQEISAGEKASPPVSIPDNNSGIFAILDGTVNRLSNGNPDEKKYSWMLSYCLAQAATVLQISETGRYLYKFAALDSKFKTYNWRAVQQKKFIPSIIKAASEEGSALKPGSRMKKDNRYLTVNKIALLTSGSMNQLYSVSDKNGKDKITMKKITSNITKGGSHRSTVFDFDMDLSLKANISFGEVISMLKTHYPYLQPNRKVTFKVSEELNEDSRSAGLGLSLLLCAMYEGVQLDPNAVSCADISVNGKVLSGYDITEKIKFAGSRPANLLLVSPTDYQALMDSYILWGHTALWNCQIIAVRDLSEAMEAARFDKSDSVKQAIEDFAKVQRFLRGDKNRFFNSKATLIKQLGSILRKLPTHASARAIYDILRGKTPSELSLNTSIDLFMKTCKPCISEIFENKKTTAGVKRACNARLKRIRKAFNRVMQQLIDAMITYNDETKAGTSDQQKALFLQTWRILNKNRQFVDRLR